VQRDALLVSERTITVQAWLNQGFLLGKL
jgi:hypothetical protein